MTRFDEEPSPGGDWPSWLRPMREQTVAFVAAIVATSVAASIAAGLLIGSQVALLELARLVSGTPLAVVLGPQVTRAEADALRSRIESSALVASATLQTREQALARVGVSVEATVARNPLPDVWMVSPRGPSAEPAMRTFTGDLAALRESLGHLPGVVAVRVDTTWLMSIDRWMAAALDALPVVQWATLAILATTVGCVAFLAGRSCRPSLKARAAGRDPTGLAASAGFGLLVGGSALLLVIATAAVAWNVVHGERSEWGAVRETVLMMALPSLITVAVVVSLACSIGVLLGRRE